MFDTGHQGRANLVLAVPCGFGPINHMADGRDHLPLMMEVPVTSQVLQRGSS